TGVIDARRRHRMKLAGPGIPELDPERVPEVLRGPVVAERPHPGPQKIVVDHEVVLIAQRGGVVVVQLAPAAVVAAAGIAGRRAVPRDPWRGRDVVPRLGERLRPTA